MTITTPEKEIHMIEVDSFVCISNTDLALIALDLSLCLIFQFDFDASFVSCWLSKLTLLSVFLCLWKSWGWLEVNLVLCNRTHTAGISWDLGLHSVNCTTVRQAWHLMNIVLYSTTLVTLQVWETDCNRSQTSCLPLKGAQCWTLITLIWIRPPTLHLEKQIVNYNI